MTTLCRNIMSQHYVATLCRNMDLSLEHAEKRGNTVYYHF